MSIKNLESTPIKPVTCFPTDLISAVSYESAKAAGLLDASFVARFDALVFPMDFRYPSRKSVAFAKESVTVFKGIGGALAAHLGKLGIKSVRDLVYAKAMFQGEADPLIRHNAALLEKIRVTLRPLR